METSPWTTEYGSAGLDETGRPEIAPTYIYPPKALPALDALDNFVYSCSHQNVNSYTRKGPTMEERVEMRELLEQYLALLAYHSMLPRRSNDTGPGVATVALLLASNADAEKADQLRHEDIAALTDCSLMTIRRRVQEARNLWWRLNEGLLSPEEVACLRCKN